VTRAPVLALVDAVVAVTLALPGAPMPAGAQGRELHGESAVFSESGVAIVWGVLRAPVEAETQVVTRIALGDATYAYVRVDAVDPFTRARRPVAPGGPMSGTIDVRSPRATFGDFPRREVRLYRTAGDWRADAPVLTIYYLGVPDTTPEFVSEAALLSYLATTVAKARAPGERTK
jgi:hypothetical protein